MTTIEKIAHYQTLWGVALPHLEQPTSQDAVRWCAYPLESVEAAILRAAKRFAAHKVSQSFDAQEAYRYTTATARHIAQGGRTVCA